MSIAQRNGQRLLSLDDVLGTPEPAVFTMFGEHLVCVQGVVYSLPSDPCADDISEPLRMPGAYVLKQYIGIEYGWRHLAGCSCPHCAGAQDSHVPEPEARRVA